MTSFAFILGVVPLALAKGAGAEMRVPLGVAVFSGMLGVTILRLWSSRRSSIRLSCDLPEKSILDTFSPARQEKEPDMSSLVVLEGPLGLYGGHYLSG